MWQPQIMSAVVQKMLYYPQTALPSEALRMRVHTYIHTGPPARPPARASARRYLRKIAFWISAPRRVSQEVQLAVRWEGSSGKTERSILAVWPGQETVWGKKKKKVIRTFKIIF